MKRGTKLLLIGLMVLVASLSVAFVILAQTTGTQAASAGKRSDLWEKVAANLGITRAALVAAFDQAEVQLIDEALTAGTITEEQAQRMKAGIEARRAMDAVLEQAIADGKITQDQLALLGRRGGIPGMCGRRGFLPSGKGGGNPGCLVPCPKR